MKFKAEITVVSIDSTKDPLEKSISKNLKSQNLDRISLLKMGKHFTLEVEANSKNAASAFVEEACKSVLADASEDFTFVVEEI